MSGLLEGKRLLVTGVLTDDSLAFSAARHAQEQGAQVVLSGAGRGLRLTQRVAKHLPDPPDVLELDVTQPEHIATVRAALERRWGALDGIVHAIAFAPAEALGGGFMDAGWEVVSTAVEISAFSLKLLAAGLRPLMVAAGGGSIVGLDFDATVAWPGYDWMGVAKAALESTARYLARDLGPDNIRVNLVAAGPVRTVAAKSIPGFSLFEDVWDGRAPLGWDINDPDPVGRACVALLSDWFPATTGEMLHVDGGYHAMGA
ncbi:enoyl-ACP reductase FabI [Acidiferrimicrobium sp. IK]|uniref:enoyl-ACP reductase FabI n=1 Tax=Acidiferrimicrobium sp. IK TaxID=2871700 RepID=UPI0021CB621F|nr:enoyl-ACP reductase FabI [Acidiferrimicrobium sp. IK]MCU4185887.1 enoyl-ACP reductase FabI [Acidiferrimicrobium sp. IK]